MIYIKSVGCSTGDCFPDPCLVFCPEPTVQCDYITASLTKCGHLEWEGYESNPPKVYLNLSLAGYMQGMVYLADDCTSEACYSMTGIQYGGTCNYDRSTCNISNNGYYISYAGEMNNCSNITYDSSLPACDIVNNSTGFTYSVNATSKVATGDGCSPATGLSTEFVGSASSILSSEYSTALLISDTEAALPSYPNSWSGESECYSMRDLSSDEMTYSIRRFQYRFALPTLSNVTCYRIDWDQNGTSMNYVWDGVATVTPTYGPILEPNSNGTISAPTNITYSCTC